jgi:hypothetical protein
VPEVTLRPVVPADFDGLRRSAANCGDQFEFFGPEVLGLSRALTVLVPVVTTETVVLTWVARPAAAWIAALNGASG